MCWLRGAAAIVGLLDMDATAAPIGEPATRFCLSVEQMTPYLEKLRNELAASNGNKRLPSGKRFQDDDDDEWTEVEFNPNEEDAGADDNDDESRSDHHSTDHNHHRRADDTASTTNAPSQRPPVIMDELTRKCEMDYVEMVNHIELIDLNPIVESANCPQMDELFEGNVACFSPTALLWRLLINRK